jgi:transposase
VADGSATSDRRAAEILAALWAPQLAEAPLVADAYATSVAALTIVIKGLSQQIAAVEAKLVDRFERHADAAFVRSQPGLGSILGARALAEFGDAPNH